MDGPTIPTEVRQAGCAAALEAQQACLDLFDAIEGGDLALAALAQRRVASHAEEVRQALLPLAAIHLLRSGLLPGETDRD